MPDPLGDRWGRTHSILCDRLRYAREARGLSQEALSVEIFSGDASSVCRYETGSQVPHLRTAVRLARALSVSLDWLVGMSDRGGPGHG